MYAFFSNFFAAFRGASLGILEGDAAFRRVFGVVFVLEIRE
jgi:hypothetical protein